MVAPIAVPQGLANKALWGAPLRRSVALATYTEAALATDEWDPLKLEAELLRRRQSELPTTGELRSVLKGSAPRKHLVARIASSLPDRAIAYWANHPLFHMLDARGNEPLLHASIVYALDSLEGPIRGYFWRATDTDWSRGSADPQADIFPEAAALEAALNDRREQETLSELDWLVLNVAIYFQAKRLRAFDLVERAALNADSGFLLAVLQHPQLLVSWDGLREVMEDKIWGVASKESKFRHNHKDGIPAAFNHLSMISSYSFPDELLKLAGLNKKTPEVLPG